ncbi:hypothetical protein [Cesiribacter andamanensis]|uniref:Uncharacterized protein n=1 Tax=Cesiribacter andamanensis AMV16 TaxID=1279009 RepID=M7NI19_9BACT|nr:hypothetical protein [Cesiribacter andamanensis]EMR01455.1 hypothetical protein ADICEAN_03411 [Cesiribacter andamanensis AMV16]
MKKEWIKTMKVKKRLRLSFWRYIDHYSIVLFMLFITGLFAVGLFHKYVTGTYTGALSSKELLTITGAGCTLAFILYLIQRKRLKFTEITIQHTEQHFQEAVQRTVSALGWIVETNGKDFFRAYRPWNFTLSWGEMITIIRQKDKLLLNSICDPNQRWPVVSAGWNKKNIHTFLIHLADAIEEIPAAQITNEPENMWTFRRIAIRFFAYPFSIFLIVMGIYMISHPLSMGNAAAGFGVILAAVFYMYADVKLLLDKKK